MLKVVFFTGNQPRHSFLARQLYQNSLLCGVIREQRDNFIPSAPNGLSEHLTKLFNHHFAQRDICEHKFFEEDWRSFPTDVPILDIAQTETNSEQVVSFLQKLQPDLVLGYGCHLINKATHAALPNTSFWNFHGGLSPFYRGTITHFWPSYFLEPQMTGVTLHEATDVLDAGDILLQTCYVPHKEDTLHATACRVVRASAIQVAQYLSKLEVGNLPRGVTQTTRGKLFVNSDWRVEHLRVIYDFYDDAIPSLVVSGEIEGKVPKKLINVFEGVV